MQKIIFTSTTIMFLSFSISVFSSDKIREDTNANNNGALKPSYSINYMNALKKPKSFKKEKVNAPDAKGKTRNNNRVISLNKALEYTQIYNPSLKANSHDAEGKEALIQQSKLFVNPEIETELENFGSNAYSISIGQLIELGGKRASRIKHAKLEKKAVLWEYEIKRLNLLIKTAKQYLKTLKSKEKIILLKKLLSLSKESHKIAEKRKNAGAATVIETLQTKKDIELTSLELKKEINNLKLQLQLLTSFWDEKNTMYTSVSGQLNVPGTIPGFNTLVNKINNSPDITSWVIQYEILKNMQAEAEAQVVPDLSISAGYEIKKEEDEKNILLGFSFPLPLWDRNQGNIKETKTNLLKAELEKKALETQIYNDLLSTYIEFQNTYREIEIFNTRLLPIVRNTYKEAKKFYKVGKISSLELLSYQRELIESEGQFLNLLTEFYKLKYDLELLIGLEINITSKE